MSNTTGKWPSNRIVVVFVTCLVILAGFLPAGPAAAPSAIGTGPLASVNWGSAPSTSVNWGSAPLASVNWGSAPSTSVNWG